MTVRATMQPLIDYLRQYGQASETDVFEGANYWTDDQLQEILEDSASYKSVKLVKASTVNLRLLALDTYRHYKFEGNYVLFNCNAAVVSVSSTYDPILNTILLDSDYSGTLYLEGLCINMWRALALLWDRKAQQRLDFIDWKAGHNTMYMSQEYDHCIKQRDYYNQKIVKTFRH